MRVRKRGPRDTLIIMPTDANRDLGLFLIFVALVGTLPLWYLYSAWFGIPLHGLDDVREWYPAFVAMAVVTVLGLGVIFGSTRSFEVGAKGIRVLSGLFRGSLYFEWDEAPAIRLQRVENEVTAPGRILWLVKLVSGRYEYTLDARSNQQFQSRSLAEALAREVGCSLLERAEDGSTIEIASTDLDLPFRERATRYPQLLGVRSARPSGCAIVKAPTKEGCSYTWSLGSTGLYIDVVVVGLLCVLLSAFPWAKEQTSFLEAARSSGDFRFYYAIGTVLGSAALLLSGYRIRLEVTPKHVQLRQSLWSLPLSQQRTETSGIEEIEVVHTVRGPAVQILSDTRILAFRAQDGPTASWIAYEVRQYLMQSEDERARGCPEGAEER